MQLFKQIRLKRLAKKAKFDCISDEDLSTEDLKILKELLKGDEQKIRIIGKR